MSTLYAYSYDSSVAFFDAAEHGFAQKGILQSGLHKEHLIDRHNLQIIDSNI